MELNWVTQAREIWAHSRVRWLGISALALMVFWVSYRTLQYAAERDPDRYYHFAVARQVEPFHPLRTFPQVEDLGWGVKFPEKEFLFHEVIGIAYRFGGESAVSLAVAVAGFSSFLILVWICSEFLGFWPSVFSTLSLTLFSRLWALRLVMIRPHVFGILFFTLILAGLLKRRSGLTLVAGLLFALSYHAIYLPAFLLLVAGFSGKRNLRLPALAGLGGLVLGSLLNPYFPLNISMGLLHLKIALHLVSVPVKNWGSELVPYSPETFLVLFHFPLLILFLSFFQLRKTDHRSGDRLWLMVVTAVFWLAMMASPRALEYAFPMITVLSAAVFIPILSGKSESEKLKVSAMMAVFSLFTQGTLWSGFASQSSTEPLPSQFEKVLSVLPPDSHDKVFNCTWDISPYVLYFRPQMRVVDVLDPSLLYQHAPEKYLAREKILAGDAGDLGKTLRGVFGADYLLCNNSGLFTKLKARADLALLAQSGEVYLFRVNH